MDLPQVRCAYCSEWTNLSEFCSTASSLTCCSTGNSRPGSKLYYSAPLTQRGKLRSLPVPLSLSSVDHPIEQPFRRQDILGCALAVIGGVTVIFGSRSNDKKLFPDELLAAISSPLFTAYAIVSLVTLVVLVRLSNTRYGETWVMVDVGICAVAGGWSNLMLAKAYDWLNLA